MSLPTKRTIAPLGAIVSSDPPSRSGWRQDWGETQDCSAPNEARGTISALMSRKVCTGTLVRPKSS